VPNIIGLTRKFLFSPPKSVAKTKRTLEEERICQSNIP
ncbi:hypothetical protein CDAR_49241, partial [Caerostris darwini]